MIHALGRCAAWPRCEYATIDDQVERLIEYIDKLLVRDIQRIAGSASYAITCSNSFGLIVLERAKLTEGAVAAAPAARESAIGRAIREMQSGIERRKLGHKFALFQKYPAEMLDRSV